MRSGTFNEAQPTAWPLFTTAGTVRSHFPSGTAVIIAIGGWGDNTGYAQAAVTMGSRRLFAENVKAMVDATGADGALETAGLRFVLADQYQALISIGSIQGQYYQCAAA